MIGYSLPRVLLIFGLLAPAMSLTVLAVVYYVLVGVHDLPDFLVDAIPLVYVLFGLPDCMCGFALWAFGAFEGRSFRWQLAIAALIVGASHIVFWWMQVGKFVTVIFITAIAAPSSAVPILACGLMARRFARQPAKATLP